jgi:DNA-binding response OmpR family regulator
VALRRRKDDEWDGVERRRPPAVVVVNDDEDACELLVRFLGHAGFLTVGAHSLEEATVAVHDHLPRAVVLDMTRGGIGSSLRILDVLRSHDDHRISTTRVVLCGSSRRNRAFSFQSGADGFVVRPFHLQDLIDEVNEAVARPHEARARHRRDEIAAG